MKCLNESCQKELSEFDIRRLDIKFSWQRFCIDCRRYKKRIKCINCQMCNRQISFKVGSQNVIKIYCSDCAEIRHRSRNVKLANFKLKY